MCYILELDNHSFSFISCSLTYTATLNLMSHQAQSSLVKVVEKALDMTVD